MLIEIFCQKPIVSNFILAFLDHLKPKMFFVSQPWWPTQLLFKIPASVPAQWSRGLQKVFI